jgi:hypothetical protein
MSSLPLHAIAKPCMPSKRKNHRINQSKMDYLRKKEKNWNINGPASTKL